jgi:hypothetical protein
MRIKKLFERNGMDKIVVTADKHRQDRGLAERNQATINLRRHILRRHKKLSKIAYDRYG